MLCHFEGSLPIQTAGIAFKVCMGTLRTRQRAKLAKYFESEMKMDLLRNLAKRKAQGNLSKLEKGALTAGIKLADVSMDAQDPWHCPYEFNTWSLPDDIAEYAAMPTREKKPKKKKRNKDLEKSMAGSMYSRIQSHKSRQRQKFAELMAGTTLAPPVDTTNTPKAQQSLALDFRNSAEPG